MNKKYAYLIRHRVYPLEATVILDYEPELTTDERNQLAIDVFVLNMQVLRSDYMELHDLDNNPDNYQIERVTIAFSI